MPSNRAARSSDPAPSGDALAGYWALERARARRIVAFHAMALWGLPVWLSALWPQPVLSNNRRLVLLIWAWLALSAGAAALSEWRSLRRRRSAVQ